MHVAGHAAWALSERSSVNDSTSTSKAKDTFQGHLVVSPELILRSGRISPRCLGIGCYTPSWPGWPRHHITRISAAGRFGSSHVKAVRAPAHFEGRKIDPARAQITGLLAPCHDRPGGECLDLENRSGPARVPGYDGVSRLSSNSPNRAALPPNRRVFIAWLARCRSGLFPLEPGETSSWRVCHQR
jgi:hypothetical protein